MAVGLDDGSVWFRSIDTGKTILATPAPWERPPGQLDAYHSYTSDFIAFSPDSRFAAVIGPETAVSIWDLRREVEVAREALPPKSESQPRPAYWSLAFSSAADLGFEHPTGRATYPGKVSTFSPDGTILAVGHQGSEFWAEDQARRVTL